jgi:hypothetical protein
MKIFGQVVDTDGLPMSLANITIITGDKAYKFGEIADLDGKFVLDDASITADSQFKVSYVGYIPQFFKASELQGKKITLKEDNTMLNEVVIVRGGGKPKDTTGKDNTSAKVIASTKTKFVKHLKDHKFAYAGLGGLAGIFFIVKALKK